MTPPEEVDPALVRYVWPHLLFDAVDLLGPSLVYNVGLEAIGYPPTIISSHEEHRQVEAALITHLQRKFLNGTAT